MNPEKLKKLQAEVRIGGKGSQRRKKKIVHTNPASDDKKLKQTLKKLSIEALPGIEEVNIIRTNGTVLHIRNPKTQAALAINTFAITGNGVEKTIAEMLPNILPQLGPRVLKTLKRTPEMDVDPTSSATATTTSNAAANTGAEDLGKIYVKARVYEKSETAEAEDFDDMPELIDNFEAVALGLKKECGECKNCIDSVKEMEEQAE